MDSQQFLPARKKKKTELIKQNESYDKFYKGNKITKLFTYVT